MSSLNLNEQAALSLVLEFIPLKDLISSAMEGFSHQQNVRAKDNADLCYKAMTAFLK